MGFERLQVRSGGKLGHDAGLLFPFFNSMRGVKGAVGGGRYLAGQSHLKIDQGKEARFLSCELESRKLTAQNNCLLGMEESILPPHWLKIALLIGRAERKLPNAIALR